MTIARVGDRVRLSTALLAGKITARAGRYLGKGGGTSLPGIVARRIDPAVLSKVVGASPASKVVITGSNGKTTTCRFTAALAQQAGLRVVQNRAGSNLLQGVTAVAVNGADVLGRIDTDSLIFEVDEATVRRVAPDIGPGVVLVTNIFRDQLDRYGELHAVAGSLDAVVQGMPAGTAAVLNGDDPMVADFGKDTYARRLFFGVDAPQAGSDAPEHAADTVRCVRCQHDLEYDCAYLSHLGAYRCPNCGYARPPLDVAVTGVESDASGGSRLEVETPVGPIAFTIPLPGIHNVYNAAAAITVGVALGLDLSVASTAFASMRPAFGRLEEIQAGDKCIVLSFVKNPISYNATLRAITQQGGAAHILSAFSNTDVDGEDFSWLWDVELEEIGPRVVSLVAAGAKAEEVAMRFKYAGVPEDRMQIVHDLTAALDAGLSALQQGETLHILSGYTPTRQLRNVMHQRGWVNAFWEE